MTVTETLQFFLLWSADLQLRFVTWHPLPLSSVQSTGVLQYSAVPAQKFIIAVKLRSGSFLQLKLAGDAGRSLPDVCLTGADVMTRAAAAGLRWGATRWRRCEFKSDLNQTVTVRWMSPSSSPDCSRARTAAIFLWEGLWIRSEPSQSKIQLFYVEFGAVHFRMETEPEVFTRKIFPPKDTKARDRWAEHSLKTKTRSMNMLSYS